MLILLIIILVLLVRIYFFKKPMPRRIDNLRQTFHNRRNVKSYEDENAAYESSGAFTGIVNRVSNQWIKKCVSHSCFMALHRRQSLGGFGESRPQILGCVVVGSQEVSQGGSMGRGWVLEYTIKDIGIFCLQNRNFRKIYVTGSHDPLRLRTRSTTLC